MFDVTAKSDANVVNGKLGSAEPPSFDCRLMCLGWQGCYSCQMAMRTLLLANKLRWACTPHLVHCCREYVPKISLHSPIAAQNKGIFFYAGAATVTVAPLCPSFALFIHEVQSNDSTLAAQLTAQITIAACLPCRQQLTYLLTYVKVPDTRDGLHNITSVIAKLRDRESRLCLHICQRHVCLAHMCRC